MATTQKALLLDSPMGKFVLGEVKIPKPAKGEILIRVKSAALNPVDWKIQKYNAIMEEYPCILGSDIAGDVEAVGEGVTDFKKGDRVFFLAEFVKDRGAFQQYVASFARTVSKIPPNLSYDDVSTLPMGLSTAFNGLYNADPTHGLGITPPFTADAVGKYAGTPIVILGGGSSVAQFAIQLAKISGFSPIITTASSKHTEALIALGATHVFDRNWTADKVKAEIAKITTKPVEYVYDSISIESTQRLAHDILAPGGSAVFTLNPTFSPTEGKKFGMPFASLTIPQNLVLYEPLYHDHIYGWLEKGLIIPNPVEVLPNGLEGIIDGLKRLEADQVSRLKLVARPQETA
ncbi:GroES-like protein [Agrocybe pediades]|nr:GroES-like protein [Agrocybe pediades]